MFQRGNWRLGHKLGSVWHGGNLKSVAGDRFELGADSTRDFGFDAESSQDHETIS